MKRIDQDCGKATDRSLLKKYDFSEAHKKRYRHYPGYQWGLPDMPHGDSASEIQRVDPRGQTHELSQLRTDHVLGRGRTLSGQQETKES